MKKKIICLAISVIMVLSLFSVAAFAVEPEGLFAGKFTAGTQIFDCQRGGWNSDRTTYSTTSFALPFAYSTDTGSGRSTFTAAELTGKYFMFKETGDATNSVALYLYNDDGTPAVVAGKTAPNRTDGFVNSGNVEVIADEGFVYITPSAQGGLGYVVSNKAGHSIGDSLLLHVNIKGTPTIDDLKAYDTSDTIVGANQVIVAFQSNGGSSVADAAVTKGGKITAPTVTNSDTSKILEGWYTEATFENKWNFENDTVASAMTLFANWETPDVPAPAPVKPSNGEVHQITAVTDSSKEENPDTGYEAPAEIFAAAAVLVAALFISKKRR